MIVVDSNISQHFRPDEREFINQVLDMINIASGQYRAVLSNFFNPRQIFIAKTLVNREDNLHMQTWGGYPHAEMQRLLIYPDYYEPVPSDFRISYFQINYPTKFAELEHRQILGTLIGSGVKRERFGDIINQSLTWQLVVNEELDQFIRQSINRIGRVHVEMKKIDADELIHPVSDWEPMQTTVPSLRLDAVIANVLNYSRNRAKEAIEHGFVRVNWEPIERPDFQLAIHDLISVRHGGRIQLLQTAGKNRKNNLRLALQVIKA